MRFEVNRTSIRIIPENPQDEAYIEDTLKLRNCGEYIKLVRVAPMGLPCSLAYLSTETGLVKAKE